jgi:hypothetical protein
MKTPDGHPSRSKVLPPNQHPPSIVQTMDDAQLRRLSVLSALKYQPENLLKGGKTIEQLWHEAVSGFRHATHKLSTINPASPLRGDDGRSEIYSVCRAFREALAFFAEARRRSGDGCFAFALHLGEVRDQVEETIAELRTLPDAARLFENRASAQRKKAERWRGKGTRGIDPDAPRNRLVLRLLDEMEYAQAIWTHDALGGSNFSDGDRESLKSAMHERVREMILLPPLSPDCASAYHRVGLAMLTDATGARGNRNFTRHPAFQRGGEFFGLVTGAKAFTGTLSEAWKTIAKWRERGGKPTS